MAVNSVLSSPLGHPACHNDAKALQFIEDNTRDTGAVQEMVLADILSTNSDTEYLRRYTLVGNTDRATFKSKVPVVTYEDLHSDIQRIANGDPSPILSAHPTSEFLTSSGTSAGGRKLMPTTHQEMGRRQKLYSLLMPVMNLCVPGLDQGKGLYFLFVKSETKTPGGLVARPVLTSYYKSEHFRSRLHDPFAVYTSPIEAILCDDSFQSMYAQMMCGLYDRAAVLRLGAVFASGLLRAIRFLQLNWEELAADIRSGVLSPRVTDPAVRACLQEKVTPDSELADLVATECTKPSWEGIIARIWPKTKYLDVIVTGAMAPYIPTLDFYSGGLPLACTMYASSECYFGLNLNPMCRPSEVSYTIMPNMAYFEFISCDDDDDGDSCNNTELSGGSPPRLVDLVEVELGKEYELVVTTYAGLYRYRVGDILRVTGFHNSAPQFHFVRRKNVLLSIDSDKTDEGELQVAVEKASELLRELEVCVVDYTSYADTKTIPGHYVIYWELLPAGRSRRMPTEEALQRCCVEMEEWMNAVYRQGRVADNSIGALELRVVKSGTFEELMDYAISMGASINQFKVPRCVNCTPVVELLDSRVVSSHFSPSSPHWTSDWR